MSRRSLLQSIKNSDNINAKNISINLVHDIQSIIDSDNSSVLHLTANNNNFQLTKYFIDTYNQLIQKYPDQFSNSSKKKWLSAKDNQGFSCLHYAVFRSNYQLALFLEEQGADIYQINNQGLTVLHIAAQGDSPLLMFYYLNKGLKLQVLDSKGSTPLHWACYSGQQNSAFALISWGASIDMQQLTFGMTPLHLSVMSGNGRIVKKLLLKGCDRNIRNYNGKLPLDIAKQNQYFNIKDMILDKRGIQQLLNIKTPFRKLHKHTLPFYIFLILFSSNYILNISFVVGQRITTQTDLAIIFLILGFIVIVFYALCYFSNPGKLKAQKTQGYYQMLVKNKPYNICFDCKIVKPQRSRHCQICDTCISVYDHHCPWIANCVGAGNYCYFFSFLLSLLLFLGYTIIYQIINICETNNWNSMNSLDVIRVICQVYGIICGIIFFIPLIFLLTVQSRNALQNKTTFERYSYIKPVRRNTGFSISQQSSLRSTLKQKQNQSVQFSKGTSPDLIKRNSTNNCYLMCCGNKNNIIYQKGI